MAPSRLTLALALALALGQSACLDDRCGEGQKYSQGCCWPILDGAVDSSGADLSEDAAGDATAGDAAAGDAGLEASIDLNADAGLGAACTSDASCKGAADYCAKQPGSPTGYCTFKGCDPKNDTCPAGYYCLDLTAFDPKLPTFCAPKTP